MESPSVETIASLIVRVIGVIVILYSAVSLIKSPAFVERSIGQDECLDFHVSTISVGKYKFVLPKQGGRALVLGLYLIQIASGVLLVVASRPIGRLLAKDL